MSGRISEIGIGGRAFSPADTMLLSSRAKVLMAVHAASALLLTLIIIARAVGAIQ